MEDINDCLPTEGKRYYMSLIEYCYRKDYIEKLADGKTKNVMKTHRFEASVLVCASNKENARVAVKNAFEADGQYSVLRCRIENLIVGE